MVARPTQRTFSAEHKLRILEEADACTPEERGALLRREGLHASHLTSRRKQRDKGSLAGLAPRKRGPKKDADQAKSRRIAELEREVEQLRARLEKAETVIEVQKNLRSAWFSCPGAQRWQEQLIEGVEELAALVGTAEACRVLGVPRATLYRRRNPKQPAQEKVRARPARALSDEERQGVLSVLRSERFVDQAPAAAYATLLDEDGIYLCSIRTMYRILEEHNEVRERRNQLRHPSYRKPELLATGPNQVWSWDITKLLGPAKWNYFYLYVILDIYSRYVVGWMIAPRESATLAERLIANTAEKQRIGAGQLTVHADRGSAMTSKAVAFLLADLGITKSHSQPYTSSDNPFSEAQFKTLKYRPEFPERFGSIQDARAFCQDFFDWYNKSHRRSGIGLLTPETLHYGRADKVLAERQRVLDAAYAAHPERFVRNPPRVPRTPTAVWINPPQGDDTNSVH